MVKGRKWEMAFLLTEGIFLKNGGDLGGVGRRWSKGINLEISKY